MSVLTGMLEMCFWFRIRLTKVQRLTVKSEINETVGGFFFLKLKQLLIFFPYILRIEVSKLLRTGVKLPGLQSRMQLLRKTAPY